MSSKDASVKIIKYADDTVVIGMISENDETEYRDSIEYVSNWCAENYLDLNVTKTKKIITDFRRKQNVKDPVTINGSEVDVVKTYKYLGVTIQEDLKWDSHIDNQLKKCNKRMYHVRCLKKLNIDHKIIVLFYNSVISSLLTYAISSWYSACSDKLKNDVNKPGKKVSKMLCPMYKESVIVPKCVYEKKCCSLVSKILKDPTHPLFACYNLLPHGNRLNMPFCRTNRFHDTFVPSSIKLFNKSCV